MEPEETPIDDKNIDKHDLEIIELSKRILSTEEVDPQLNLIYIQRLLKRQNLRFNMPKPNCKKCNGRGWASYVPKAKEYPGSLPIACDCVCDFRPIDPSKGVPRKPLQGFNRAKRRKLEKYRGIFKRNAINPKGENNGQS